MSASKPVALCTHLLPSGKLCQAAALRNERLCRHHIRNHRFLERERAHNEAMARLFADLDAMSFPELLQTLDKKLDRITNIVRAYPEARLTLGVVLERLADLNLAASITAPQLQPNQSASFNPIPINVRHTTAAQSIS